MAIEHAPKGKLGDGKPWLILAHMAAVALISLASVVAMRIPNPKVEAADRQLRKTRENTQTRLDHADTARLSS